MSRHKLIVAKVRICIHISKHPLKLFSQNHDTMFQKVLRVFYFVSTWITIKNHKIGALIICIAISENFTNLKFSPQPIRPVFDKPKHYIL